MVGCGGGLQRRWKAGLGSDEQRGCKRERAVGQRGRHLPARSELRNDLQSHFGRVGAFNGDGKLDLAVANASSNNVSIFLGNGDGTFQTVVNYPVGSAPVSVAVGDFNGDGNLDLAVANFSSNNVSILLGNGNGTFQAATNYAAGASPISVAVGG